MIEKSKEHLDTVSESYVQHMAFAFKYGLGCFAAGFMAIVHGICPSCFETAASEKVEKLADKGRKRKRIAPSEMQRSL